MAPSYTASTTRRRLDRGLGTPSPFLGVLFLLMLSWLALTTSFDRAVPSAAALFRSGRVFTPVRRDGWCWTAV
ncbi:hypothetical protein EDB83DRAFT_2370319 [Lactarius deliciosus]|nr:hypothetical protein EDB83DRAFT_2370319 [Lactarius deliciosus]